MGLGERVNALIRKQPSHKGSQIDQVRPIFQPVPAVVNERTFFEDRVICTGIQARDTETGSITPMQLEMHSHVPDQSKDRGLLDEMVALLMGADPDDVYNLFFQAAYQHEDSLRHFLKNELISSPLLALIRTTSDGPLVGYVMMDRKDEDSNKTYTAAAYMRPEHRRKGLLRQSLKQIFQHAEELGLAADGKVLFSYDTYRNGAMSQFCTRMRESGCDMAYTQLPRCGQTELTFTIRSAQQCF